MKRTWRHVKELQQARQIYGPVRLAERERFQALLSFSFATHPLETSYDIRTIQELLGRKDVSTIMMYTHVLSKGGHGVRSPIDGL